VSKAVSLQWAKMGLVLSSIQKSVELHCLTATLTVRKWFFIPLCDTKRTTMQEQQYFRRKFNLLVQRFPKCGTQINLKGNAAEKLLKIVPDFCQLSDEQKLVSFCIFFSSLLCLSLFRVKSLIGMCLDCLRGSWFWYNWERVGTPIGPRSRKGKKMLKGWGTLLQ
jgi:hypothetical protein